MKYFDKITTAPVNTGAIILAIESSCDETAASIVKGGREILSSVVLSSMTEHVRFGGVVPEIASRAHTVAISQAVESAVSQAKLTLQDIDAIAVTYGSGLIGALLVGVSYAKALAFSLGIPLVPVSHVRGHVSASYLTDKELKPPFICLLASGGHTAIIDVKDYDDYEILGGTLDDAVGEAFDKVARVLGLEYPGGPNVERLAKDGKPRVELPTMLKGKSGYDFSYSGLKTAVINYAHKMEQKNEEYSKRDLACSFQCSAIDVLVKKALTAVKEKGYSVLTVGGGVAANGYLREKLSVECEKLNVKLVLPEKKLCTDNACMIGAEGYIQYLKRNFAPLSLNAKAFVELSSSGKYEKNI